MKKIFNKINPKKMTNYYSISMILFYLINMVSSAPLFCEYENTGWCQGNDYFVGYVSTMQDCWDQCYDKYGSSLVSTSLGSSGSCWCQDNCDTCVSSSYWGLAIINNFGTLPSGCGSVTCGDCNQNPGNECSNYNVSVSPTASPTQNYDDDGVNIPGCNWVCEQSNLGDGTCDYWCSGSDCNYDNGDCSQTCNYDSCDNIYDGHCGFFTQETDKWCELAGTTNRICCADSSGECCEDAPGPIAGIVIAIVAMIGVCIYCCRRRRDNTNDTPPNNCYKFFCPVCAVCGYQGCGESKMDSCLVCICCCIFSLCCWEPKKVSINENNISTIEMQNCITNPEQVETNDPIIGVPITTSKAMPIYSDNMQNTNSSIVAKYHEQVVEI